METYPEHAKLKAVSEEALAVSEFLENISRLGLVLCDDPRGTSDRYFPTSRNHSAILAAHFDIDQDALEKEKRSILQEYRDAAV